MLQARCQRLGRCRRAWCEICGGYERIIPKVRKDYRELKTFSEYSGIGRSAGSIVPTTSSSSSSFDTVTLRPLRHGESEEFPAEVESVGDSARDRNVAVVTFSEEWKLFLYVISVLIHTGTPLLGELRYETTRSSMESSGSYARTYTDYRLSLREASPSDQM